MKKLFLVFFISFVFLFLFSGIVKADGVCIDPATGTNTVADFIATGKGVVPCGQTTGADNNLVCPCQFGHFGILLLKIYNFAIKFIIIPIAGLAVVVAGLYMLVSAGNPAMFERGKKILIYTIVAIALIFGAYLMIDILLKALGYPLPWNVI
ncbi:MAG: hypothetical protein ACHQVK_01035 [Candidatus Paceibacterales bacterium]